MVIIKCDIYEKGELIRFLDYAKTKKIEDCNNDKITPKLLKLELEKIEILKKIINGKCREDYQQTRNI